MGKEKKATKITNKEQLIRAIADTTNTRVEVVKGIYNSLENKIKILLSETTLTQDVTIRLFEGISIDSKYIPEKEKINNLNHQKIITTSKIKPKANITRSYIEKLNADV